MQRMPSHENKQPTESGKCTSDTNLEVQGGHSGIFDTYILDFTVDLDYW